MLGRLYAILFICTIASALWYQKIYLKHSAVEFNMQLNAENVVLPTAIGTNFNSLFFERGILKSAFCGHKITYLSDGHFEAQGNLVYQEYDNEGGFVTTIKTEQGFGETQNSNKSDSPNVFGNTKQIKYIILPQEVYFNFNGNQGKTKDVYIDALQKTVQSINHIESNGPNGHIEGTGFYYSANEGEFQLKSKVKGNFIPPQKNKKDINPHVK